MRPRKVLMLFCADENRAAELRFMLDVRGYRVVGLEQPGAADCGVVVADRLGAPAAARDMQERDRDMRMVIVGRSCELKYYPIGSRFADPKSELGTAFLLEEIKRATWRKRGPKKKLPGRQHGESISSTCASA